MIKPKKLAAMDLLLKSDSLKPAISQNSALSRSPLANLREGTPVEISPSACRPWKLADRPASETAHKAELIKSFQHDGIGQIQPIVVRNVKDPDAPEIAYEVICGRVRWMAALELGIPVQAIVRDLDDREAYLVMSAENRQRKNLSDYAKAKSYQKALAMGVFATAQEFAEAEGVSKSRFSQYLGFAELPETVAASFANIAKISYRLGYEINKACKALGNEALVELLPKIESGEISRTEIQQMQSRTFSASPPSVPAVAEAANSGTDYPAQTSARVEQADSLSEAPPQSPAALPFAARPPIELPKPKPVEPTGAATEPQLKQSFISSAGQRLFTYNQASRGWLIRIAPEVSMHMDESVMREFGKLLEAYLNRAD